LYYYWKLQYQKKGNAVEQEKSQKFSDVILVCKFIFRGKDLMMVNEINGNGNNCQYALQQNNRKNRLQGPYKIRRRNVPLSSRDDSGKMQNQIQPPEFERTMRI